MTSIIFNESSRMGSTTYDRRIAVSKEQVEALSDYVKRVRNAKGFSLSDVERKSDAAGNKIAGSYVSRIENNIADSEGVTPKKLQALAFGLEVPEWELFNVALGKLPPDETVRHEAEKLTNYFVELPRECQLDVLALTEALWRRRRPQKLKSSVREVRQPKELPKRRAS